MVFRRHSTTKRNIYVAASKLEIWSGCGCANILLQSIPVCAVLDMENIEQFSALRITPTVRALSSALRGKRENVPECSQKNVDRIFPEPEKLWFKESTAKNLRTRDFLSPTTMLNTLYADGQVGLMLSNMLNKNPFNYHVCTVVSS